jgi:hypothetical protein
MGPTKFSLLKRRQDILHDQFLAHWHTVHVNILIHKGRHKHYNQSYIQNDFQPSHTSDDLAFDGAAQMVPQSIQFINNGFQQDPLYAKFVRPDEDLFLSPEKCVVLYCQSEGHGNIPKEANQRKLLCLVRRRTEMKEDAFIATWQVRVRHMLEQTAMTGLRGVREHQVLRGAATNMGNGSQQGQPFDVVEELFFKNDESQLSMLRNPQFLDSFRAHGAMPVNEGSNVFVTQERLVYEGA